MILFASRYHRLLMCTISSASAVILIVMWYIISFEFYIVFCRGSAGNRNYRAKMSKYVVNTSYSLRH